ncbi:hypothetical protein [Sphingomonas mucosissima]|uniref:Uncharacterized protein n=1 Tax=Sphingomonas mucosissima TaxID=370959 RepID=A0A245ZQJ6_9SPHN|nr:hypothetical protein [Sphingomonas mucosissima]OWK32014.1 hypothetical protein SPMU_03350 [Sphingomonas mucosissima]
MLTIDHPNSLTALGMLNYGLQPFRNMVTGRYLLAIKLNKEAILAARVNQGFRLYVVPGGLRITVGLISAFFDDHDEPHTLRTPFIDGDDLTHDLVKLFSQESFEIYLFDEHDRELIGIVATLPDRARFVARTAALVLPRLDMTNVLATDRTLTHWFGLRTAADDAQAFDVVFTEKLYDDDRVIIEAHRPDLRGSGDVGVISLVRDEPGSYQERDIGHALLRVFQWEAVIANPVRADTGRELCDLLVVLPDALLAVQAKDSPNTEASLRRSIERKLKTTLQHLNKAADQLRGTLGYLNSHETLDLVLSDGPISIPLSDKAIYGMIVLNEMFDDHFPDYSRPVLAVAQATGRATVVLDYPALHVITNRIADPYDFLMWLDRLFGFAAEHGEFPRPQFTGPPAARP